MSPTPQNKEIGENLKTDDCITFLKQENSCELKILDEILDMHIKKLTDNDILNLKVLKSKIEEYFEDYSMDKYINILAYGHSLNLECNNVIEHSIYNNKRLIDFIGDLDSRYKKIFERIGI